MNDNPKGPKVPTERPDAAAAERGGNGADRPGFDLGGVSDPENRRADTTVPGGPKGSPMKGDLGGTDSGATDVSGSHPAGRGSGTESGS